MIEMENELYERQFIYTEFWIARTFPINIAQILHLSNFLQLKRRVYIHLQGYSKPEKSKIFS